MPTIRLKPNSAEFDTSDKTSRYARVCEMPMCSLEGDFRAPRDRSLNEHYHFCQKHVGDYNRAWNFFEGMNSAEVEAHMTSAFYGDRPTWKYREFAAMEEDLFRKVGDQYGEDTQEKKDRTEHQTYSPFERGTPEMEAILIMGLKPPVTLEEIKKEYKILAKKFHPDHNRNDPECEELLKQINMAYTILKAAYGKYEQLLQKEA